MAIFDKDKLTIISEAGDADLSKASIAKDLSHVDYDNDGQFFYITVDRILFSNPVETIKSVLDAHGFVPNLENILYCLDSFVFSIRAKAPSKSNSEDASAIKVNQYIPCIKFELPQKGKVGSTLQSFYDEIAKYEAKNSDTTQSGWTPEPQVEQKKKLKTQLKELKEENEQLQQQLNDLSQQLLKEKKSLNQASRALDSQQALPENTRICRVEHVDFKRRLIKVKSFRKVIDIPTHMLDHVPDFQSRCLITFDEDHETPMGILFFDAKEINDLEKRTAELLHVEGDMFKARDSLRNEFQIKALNNSEVETIRALKRGMQVLISIADDYVVRFAVLNTKRPEAFKSRIQEQFIAYEIGKNQLVNPDIDETQESDE
ncbi:hypothetical protein [Pleionea sediminis]|uniref:hypothetical protein n=1 Tax=Pleionea sediminis TaxID=2569479 RepID=UPI001186EA95|nr:hypothetical protein [Pleionea sediminis]